jgi:rare lipoprotein A
MTGPILRTVAILAALAVAACSSPKVTPPATPAPAPSPTPSTKYYKDDGPGADTPANLDGIPDAVPRPEPLNRFANRPYTVLGKDYVPATELRPYRERGIASWYGRKFHGQKTSISETYDMYGMTAAHPTLPLPSYARVTNVATGKTVVVRVNDRGPFLHDRVIDLSYAAAHRLGIAQRGSGEVLVEAILPTDMTVVAAALPPVVAIPPTAPAASAATTAAANGRVTPTAASASPALPIEAAPSSLPGSAGGFVVQLGAFGNYANAQAFLAHVQAQVATAQVTPKVRQSGGLWRVYVGPYPDRDEAKRAGDRLAAAFGFSTSIAPH